MYVQPQNYYYLCELSLHTEIIIIVILSEFPGVLP